MTVAALIRRPTLAPHARYRWDAVRGQHQLLVPEAVIVLNESGASIIQRCDGRPLEALVAELTRVFPGASLEADVVIFLGDMLRRGIVVNAHEPT